MIYRILCIFLRWHIRFFYPKAIIKYAGNLPLDRPYLLICDSKQSYKAALLLAAHVQAPLRFVKKYSDTLSPLRKLIAKALHVVPLPQIVNNDTRNLQATNIWNELREMIASNYPLVFFTDREHTDLKIPKGAAKLAFHTESVFDFHLNIEIIPVSINYTEQKQLHICFSEGISVSLYEKEYKQYPARTIRLITKHLEEQFSQTADRMDVLNTECKSMVSQ